MLPSFVTPKKAFDLVDCEALWNFLPLHVTPTRTIGLLTVMYFGKEGCKMFVCGGAMGWDGLSIILSVNT